MSFIEIFQQLLNKEVKLSIIGVGYVGLPLTVAFAKHLDDKFKEYNIQSQSICCQPLLVSSKSDSERNKKRNSKLSESKKEDETKGALPILFAATNSSLVGGEYIGLSKNKENTSTK